MIIRGKCICGCRLESAVELKDADIPVSKERAIEHVNNLMMKEFAEKCSRCQETDSTMVFETEGIRL